MRMRRTIEWLLAALLTGVMSIAAWGQVDHLAITQMLQEDDTVALYVSAVNENGRPSLDRLTEGELIVACEDEAYTPQACVPADELEEGIAYLICLDISYSVDAGIFEQTKTAACALIDQMRSQDAAWIMTVGDQAQTVCALTDDREKLRDAIEAVAAEPKEHHMIEGAAFALQCWEDYGETGRRPAVIYMTSGDRDVTEAVSEYELKSLSTKVRIPVFLIALSGDGAADYSILNQLARQSGGTAYEAFDQNVEDVLLQADGVIRSVYRVTVLPEPEVFGTANLSWSVRYEGGAGTASSGSYVFSLRAREPQTAETETASLVPEAETDPIETEEILTEAQTETEPARTQTEEQQTEVGQAEDKQTEAAGTAAASEEQEGSAGAKTMKEILTDDLYIVIAAAMILLAVIILLIIVLQNKKKKKKQVPPVQRYDDPSYSLNPATRIRPSDPTPSQTPASYSGLEKTVDEHALTDQDRTIDERYVYGQDDEKTVAGTGGGGIRLSLLVSFEGRTQKIEKILRDQLVLGRGENSDVDVVLGMKTDEAKQTSRAHAVLMNRPEGLYIKDNGSKNGTSLNGKEIVTETPLRHEDVLQLGKSIVRIEIDRASLY